MGLRSDRVRSLHWYNLLKRPAIISNGWVFVSAGASILDAASVKRYVTDERDRLLEQLERETTSGTGFFSRRLFKRPPQRLREFDLVLRLLSERKTKRPTAMQALESNAFGVAIKPEDPPKEMTADVSRRRLTMYSPRRLSSFA